MTRRLLIHQRKKKVILGKDEERIYFPGQTYSSSFYLFLHKH